MALRLPAIDQFGQVIDVLVSARRDADAAHRFFERAIGTTKVAPVEVVTDRAPTYPQRGAAAGLLTGGPLVRRGLRQLAIGAGAAVVTYGLGRVFGATVG